MGYNYLHVFFVDFEMPKPLLNRERCMLAPAVVTGNTETLLPDSWLQNLCDELLTLTNGSDKGSKEPLRINYLNKPIPVLKEYILDLKKSLLVSIHPLVALMNF